MRFLPTMTCWAAAVIVAWAGAAARPWPPTRPTALSSRPNRPSTSGDYDGAIARLDEAVRLAAEAGEVPGSPRHGLAAQGDYAKGAADLKAAIELNPGDAGLRYQPSSVGAALGRGPASTAGSRSPGCCTTGRRWPSSAEETRFLRGWAARKFAGEDFGAPIDWDPSPPLHSDAEHLAPPATASMPPSWWRQLTRPGQSRAIRDRSRSFGPERSTNCTTSPTPREFVRLNDEAEQGKVSKEAFVAGILKYELLAAQHTRAFYVQVFLPWAEKKKLPTDPSLWFCDWWDTPERALAELSPTSRPIRGGPTRGRTIGPRSIAAGTTDNSTRP